MRKINKYLCGIAGACVFVICMFLFVWGIENQKIDNANTLIGNKTSVSLGDESSENASNNLNNENTKPGEGEIKIKRGVKVDVEDVHIPKEKLIEAIVSGGKKVTEEDIIAIAEELNMSVIELKNEIVSAKLNLTK